MKEVLIVATLNKWPYRNTYEKRKWKQNTKRPHRDTNTKQGGNQTDIRMNNTTETDKNENEDMENVHKCTICQQREINGHKCEKITTKMS